MNPVIGFGEGNGLLRPTQGLQWFGVDELDLATFLVVPPFARVALQAANDHVDRPLGVLEWAIGVACLRRGRQVALLAAILWQVVVTSPVVAAIIVLATMLMVYIRVKFQVNLQADKSPFVVKGPFFPRVVNPWYQIRGTMRDARVDLVKPRNIDLQ
jgi:hypothetical protein